MRFIGDMLGNYVNLDQVTHYKLMSDLPTRPWGEPDKTGYEVKFYFVGGTSETLHVTEEGYEGLLKATFLEAVEEWRALQKAKEEQD